MDGVRVYRDPGPGILKGSPAHPFNVSAVVFDLFITLTDFDIERQRPQMTAELAHALHVDPEAFSSLMRNTFTARTTGATGDLYTTLEGMARSLGGRPTPEVIYRTVALRIAQERRLLTPRADVLDTLARLKSSGYRIGVITDCTVELPGLWPTLPYADLVDGTVFSCDLGCRKPAAALYVASAHGLGVPIERCLYIGDGGSQELSGAASAGMITAMLKTPFGDDFRYDAERDWQGLILEGIADVMSLVRLSANS